MVKITSVLCQEVISYCQRGYPKEACGLLGGDSQEVELVRYRLEGSSAQWSEVSLKNLNTDGAKIASDSTLHPGESVKLEIASPASGEPVRIKAKVIWSKTGTGGLKEYGLKFDVPDGLKRWVLPVALEIYPMANVEDSPIGYAMDPKEQLQVEKRMRQRGQRLVGIYHSHTASDAYPSSVDVSLAISPDVSYVLVALKDRAHPVIRSFRIDGPRIEEERVVIDDAPPSGR